MQTKKAIAKKRVRCAGNIMMFFELDWKIESLEKDEAAWREGAERCRITQRPLRFIYAPRQYGGFIPG